MLGSHGRRSKNNFYEEASRVPLIISWPAIIESNQTIKDPVSHIDVVSTILDFVGAPAGIDESDGRSLRRYLNMKTPSHTVIVNPLTRIATNFAYSSHQQQDLMIPNALYDESFVVSEWDFRKPVSSNPHGELERPIE
jgi:arylsulfatase A-like enzyme